MWEGQALPHDTKFRNYRAKIVGGRTVPNWSLIHGSSWSGLIKVGPDGMFVDKALISTDMMQHPAAGSEMVG